jgi:transglutaminase-like putative cysteine protease
MTVLSVRHKTVYRYAHPVSFGPHRLMLQPRDSHDLRVSDTTLNITPTPSLSWLHDVFGNSVAIATFHEPSTELVIDSGFRATQILVPEPALRLEPHARHYPFNYSREEQMDLGGALHRQYHDPWGRVDTWAGWFVGANHTADTLEMLGAITRSVQYQFAYGRREEMGTQDPLDTLTTQSGNCRDFALFMIEAVRSLGFGARFVSGYLYAGPLMSPGSALEGSGATHAWVQVFLPGAGWIEFDPTNALIGGENLIRVAVVRDPSQALPIRGTFSGMPSDFLGMDVEVSVTMDEDDDVAWSMGL